MGIELPETVELGQLAFSNTPIQSFEARWATQGIQLIASAVDQSRGGDGDFTMAYNAGGEPFENDWFALRAYCWCDGEAEGHEDGCPPNFEFKPTDLEICWYKHAGRGITANQAQPSDWMKIVTDCVRSVLDPDSL